MMDKLEIKTTGQIKLSSDIYSKNWVSVESLKEWLISDAWKTRDDLLYAIDESAKKGGVELN